MMLHNVEITRLITHEIDRASHMASRPPVLSDKLEKLGEKGKHLLERRIVNTLASGSHCVDVVSEDDSE